MFNIVLFQQIINDEYGLAYKVYKDLCSRDLIDKPVIYTDNYTINIDVNFPIFNAYYLRQHFHKNTIMVDYQDYKYIPKYLQSNCIVIFNPITQSPGDITCKLLLSSEDNIEEKLYGKI